MISQDTIPSVIKYCKDLINGIKAPQEVASKNAILYRDDGVGRPVTRTDALGANSTLRYLVTFNHPAANYPYTTIQYNIVPGASTVMVDQYIYPSGVTNPTQHIYVIEVRSGAVSPVSINATFGAVGVAPGTITVTTI